MKFGRDFVINMNPWITCAADEWQGYLPGNYKFHWSQDWDPLSPGKKLLSFGPFGIKQWQIMNGGLALHRHPSPNNVFFASQTRGLHSSLGLHSS